MATILVIDDRAANRDLLVTILGYKGHRLLEAGDGAEGLARVRAERPDAVITDILMPTMDGYEFVRQLRADAAVADTPVIFASAHYLEREARSLAQSCGVRHILAKPLEPERILAVVDAALAETGDAAVAPPAEGFDREHLRIVTDKLSEKTEQLRSTNGRLTALIDLGQELASERDPLRILQGLCAASRRIVGARFAAVGVLTEERRDLRFLLTSGVDAETANNLSSPMSGCGVLATLSPERPSLRLAGRGDLDRAGLAQRYPTASSLLAAALISPNKLHGWLCLTEKLGGGEFSEDDERLAVILAGMAGRIYENGRLYADVRQYSQRLEGEIAERERAAEQLRAYNLRLETLHAIARDTLAEKTPEAIAGATLARLPRLVPCDCAVVLLFPGEADGGRRLALMTASGEIEATTLAEDDRTVAAALAAARHAYADDLAVQRPFAPAVERLLCAGMRSAIVEAMIEDGECLGALSLSAARPAAFTAEHRRIAAEIAAELAIAIQQTRRRAQLQRSMADLQRRPAHSGRDSQGSGTT